MSSTMTTEYEPEHDGGTLPLYVLFPLGAMCLGILAQPWATQSVWVYLPLMMMTAFAPPENQMNVIREAASVGILANFDFMDELFGGRFDWRILKA